METLTANQVKDQVSALLDSKGDGTIKQKFYNHTARNNSVTVDRLDGHRYLILLEPDGSYTLSTNTPIHQDSEYHYVSNTTLLDELTNWMLA